MVEIQYHPDGTVERFYFSRGERESAVKSLDAFLGELEARPCKHRLVWGTCFNCRLVSAQEAADA